MADAPDQIERLEQLLDGRSRNAFARYVGLPESIMRSIFEGRAFRLEHAAMICEATGCSLEWLATGEGPQFQSQSMEAAPQGVELIPRLEVEASAGAGALVQNEEPNGTLAFQASWLRKKGISAQDARVLYARGDSMEPTLRDGDVLLVDTSIHQVKDNAIYVVVYGGLLLVKRIHLRRDGGVVLISDNPHHPQEDVPPDEVPDLQIAGRVVWFGRDI